VILLVGAINEDDQNMLKHEMPKRPQELVFFFVAWGDDHLKSSSTLLCDLHPVVRNVKRMREAPFQLKATEAAHHDQND